MTESPNKLFGWSNSKVEGIVIHYTVSETAKSAYDHFMNPSSKASAHFIIDHDGTVLNPVSENNRAFHAGISSWHGRSSCNNFMLGIELVNIGYTTIEKSISGKTIERTPYGDIFDGKSSYDLQTKKNWEIYYDPQINSLVKKINELQAKYHIPNCNIVGHNHISPKRKIDPGPLFPWDIISTNCSSLFDTPISVSKSIQSHLERLGYEIGNIDGLIGPVTRNALVDCFKENNLTIDFKDLNWTRIAVNNLRKLI